jgi:hypothetical protein
MPRYIHRHKTPITVVVEGAVEHWYYAPYYDPRKLPVIKPVEWCIPDSPAQRWLEAHGYREVEWKRFHPGEGEGWACSPRQLRQPSVEATTEPREN